MSTTLSKSGFTTDTFESFLASRNEPAWLVDARRKAWQTFESLPLPSRREEEWMRTDIRLLKLDKFAPPVDSVGEATPPAALLSRGVHLGGHATTVNSRFVSSDLNESLRAKGVWFGAIEQFAVERPELLQKHLFRVVDGKADKFAALHAACWSGGAVLYVPRNVAVAEPLHMLSAMNDTGVDFAHTLVILDEGAEATLLAETAGGQTSALHCGAVELVVGPGARLRYVSLQNWGTGTWHFAHHKAEVDRGGSIQWTIGALGSRLSKVNQHVALVGEHAEAQVNGVMFTEGKQHLSYHTLQHHRAPMCRSDLLYKDALQDSSRIVWRGMIKVDVDAQKTDGYQRNDSLMLSNMARADSIPGLEIEADDVRCTHGSTTGRVDEQQIFYAQCRGLTRKEAARMIVAGFFQQVFDRITIESVREALGSTIGNRVRELA